MPNEVSGTKMAIELRNISSNRTEAQEQRKIDRTVENSNAASKPEASGANDDTLVISDKAQEVQSLISSISQPPATDSQRIEALRTAINSGTYTVSAEKIASKLLALDFGNRNQSE